MTNVSKAESNAKNAQKSTGPKTGVGKATSSQNARSHGVLSAQLILPGEHREDFDVLFDQLQQEFRPEGLFEMTLTERIAIAIWRQRRIVSAESAQINLHQKTSFNIGVHSIRGASGSFATNELIKDMWMGTFDFESSASSEELLGTLNVWKMLADKKVDFSGTLTGNPLIDDELIQEAKDNGYKSPKLYIENEFDNWSKYVKFKCECYLENMRHAQVRELIKTYKDSVALPTIPEKMSRYQSALDNELYKAMRALREAQSWRNERRNAEASVVVANND